MDASKIVALFKTLYVLQHAVPARFHYKYLTNNITDTDKHIRVNKIQTKHYIYLSSDVVRFLGVLVTYSEVLPHSPNAETSNLVPSDIRLISHVKSFLITIKHSCSWYWHL